MFKFTSKRIAFKVILFVCSISSAFAQNQNTQEKTSFTYAEFKGGYGLTIFGKGLKERYDAGNFSSSGGGLASLAAYHKFKKVNSLVVGLKYKSLGAGPAIGDNDEEMFFNYWGAAFATKYFPMDKNAKKGLYLQADYFFITQFTQKYRNTSALVFDHQFAIGSGLAFGLGYDFPIGKGRTMWTIGLEYEVASRRGEVTNLGEKRFNNSNLGIMTGIKF
jgi:hypothetical protein